MRMHLNGVNKYCVVACAALPVATQSWQKKNIYIITIPRNFDASIISIENISHLPERKSHSNISILRRVGIEWTVFENMVRFEQYKSNNKTTPHIILCVCVC